MKWWRRIRKWVKWNRGQGGSAGGVRSQKHVYTGGYCYYNYVHRYDSLRRLQQQAEAGHEDETLKMAPWYQAGIPREIALEILHHEDIGSFIIRDSTTHAGCYALSVKVPKFDNPTGIAHYLIQRTQTGVRLKGLEKQWNNITSLVVHLSVMKEMLPCTLKMPRNSNNPSFTEMDKEGEEDSKTEDPDYHRLTDFHTVMAELTI